MRAASCGVSMAGEVPPPGRSDEVAASGPPTSIWDIQLQRLGEAGSALKRWGKLEFQARSRSQLVLFPGLYRHSRTDI